MHTDRASLAKGFTLLLFINVIARLGLDGAPGPDPFSCLSVSAGVCVSILFLEGITLWPWILLGNAISRLAGHLPNHYASIIFLSILNTVAYVLGALYLRRHQLDKSLSRLSDVRHLATASLLVGTITALSTLAPQLHGSAFSTTKLNTSYHMLHLFLSGGTGVLIIGAFILTLSPSRGTRATHLTNWHRGLYLSIATCATALVFGPLDLKRPTAWALYPPVLLCALLGDARLTARALLIVTLGALWGTTTGNGPFHPEMGQFIMLQEFLTAISITGLVFAGSSSESREKNINQARSDEAQFLSNAAVELLSTANLIESVQKILPDLAAHCDVDAALFYTAPDRPAEPLKLAAHYGLKLPSIESSSLREIERDVSKAVHEGCTVPHSTEVADPMLRKEAQPLRLMLCAPIRDDGRLLGALSLASRRATGVHPSAAHLLEAVAYYIRNASGRISQEEKLHASEIRFRELANAVPEIVWVTNAEGTPEFYNKRWYEYTGEDPSSEITSNSLITLCDAPHRDEIATRWRRCVRSGEPFEVEYKMRHNSGEYRWVLTRAAPTRSETGGVVKWFGTCTEVHKQKVLEAERDALLISERSARTEAERASRIKDDFLATLSHELRNPLNAILGWAHLLSKGLVDAQKAGGVIEQSGRLQAQLIEDLLDMSRIVSGKLSLRRELVDVSKVVLTTCDSMQFAAREKGVILESLVEPNVELEHSDTSRITQIVSNLLTNAIKFTPKGGRVTTRLARDGAECVLTVTDTGEGMPPDFLPLLFDRFRQADASTTRRHGGLGIGLAIAKHMTVLHGGEITASSPGPGRGSTFTVRLPLKPHTEGEPVSEQSKPTASVEEPKSNLTGTRIVVVEDDPPTLEFLSRFLRERGVSVAGYESGGAAVERVRAERPDLVISDIGMPDMDGYQLIRKIREICEQNGHLPIVAVTAFARAEDEERARKAGFDAHLAKPLDLARLEQVIAELLGQKQSLAGQSNSIRPT